MEFVVGVGYGVVVLGGFSGSWVKCVFIEVFGVVLGGYVFVIRVIVGIEFEGYFGVISVFFGEGVGVSVFGVVVGVIIGRNGRYVGKCFCGGSRSGRCGSGSSCGCN